MKFLQVFLVKIYCSIILVSDDNISFLERAENFFKSLYLLAPVAFIASILNAWYMDNQQFTWAVIVMIFINMVIGGWMHFRKKTFNIESLLIKTVKMIVVVGITYLVLEMVLNFGGTNFLTYGFRATLQVATLIYPGSKILKNIFVYSNGEYPPKWMMQRLYNFQENGDLQEFLNNKIPKPPAP